MKKKNYKLSGVDCAACGVKIEDKIGRLEGVYSSEYTFITERLNVLFDENIISEDIIENTIVSTISGVRVVSKRDLIVTDEDMKLTKKNDKVKMILFRKRR